MGRIVSTGPGLVLSLQPEVSLQSPLAPSRSLSPKSVIPLYVQRTHCRKQLPEQHHGALEVDSVHQAQVAFSGEERTPPLFTVSVLYGYSLFPGVPGARPTSVYSSAGVFPVSLVLRSEN